MKSIWMFFLALLVLILLTGCGVNSKSYIILWHSWEEESHATLAQTVERFESIFTDTNVVVTFVPADELEQRYIDAASQGFGPDVLIAPGAWIRNLATDGQIAAVQPDSFDTSIYYPNAVAAVTYRSTLYGIPLSMRPQILYYNRDLVETPVTTLDALLRQSDENNIAFSTEFADVLWGIQGFGGQLLDSEGRPVTNQGGLANWFDWLLQAQNEPGIFMSRDKETLLDLFLNERVAYYIGNTRELTGLRAEMGEDTIGVAPLPDGPNGPAGPILNLEALLFNPASSVSQREAALVLARFLSNVEQSTTFMRELARVPANRRVRVDARTYPAIAGFISQARTALPVPNLPQFNLLLEAGDEALIQVLEGVLAPSAAADMITRRVNEAFNLVSDTAQEICDLTGEFSLWHSWTEQELSWLTLTVNTLDARCPDLAIELRYLPERELRGAYLDAIAEGTAPDLLLAPSTWLTTLVENDAIASVPPALLQPYFTGSQHTVRYQDAYYGFPITIETQALYYNIELVSEPAATFEDLYSQLDRDINLTLPQSTRDTLWGWTAFGGITLNEERQIVVHEAGVTRWLDWLLRTRTRPTASVITSNFRRQNLFADAETAYYFGSSEDVRALSDELGSSLQITPLPTANGSTGSPLITARVLYFSARLPQDRLNTAFAIGAILTNEENQVELIQRTSWLTTNTASINTINQNPLLNELLRQAREGIVILETENNISTLATLNTLTNRVLARQSTPDEAAASLFPESETTP